MRAWVVPGVIVAAHGAGHVVVVSDWLHHGGASSIVRTSSAVVLLAATVVTLAGLAVAGIAEAVWVRPAGRWRGLVPARPGYAGLGLAVALLLLLTWATPGPTAPMYALSWGAGLASVGWLRGPAAVAAGVTGMVSAVLGAMFAMGTHALAFTSANYGD